MANFTYTWNATFLSTPQDTEDESLGAQRIRDTKASFGERFVIDHSLAGDGNDGKHTFVTLRVAGQTTAFVIDPTDGRVFAADVLGVTELFYQDSVGNVTQLTSNGDIPVPPTFPANTQMVFVQAAPPAGWTLQTGIDDRVLRVNNATSGNTGGTWTIGSFVVQGHTLTTNEMPTHSHTQNLGQGSGSGPSAWNIQPGGSVQSAGLTTDSTGGGQAHSHGITNDGSWRPAYVDVLLAFKS